MVQNMVKNNDPKNSPKKQSKGPMVRSNGPVFVLPYAQIKLLQLSIRVIIIKIIITIIIITMTMITIIIKRVPSLRVFSSTLALQLQLVPLSDNFHAFDEALIFQRQTFRSFCQRSAYLIELQLWVNQKILRSFYKFSKFKMKTSGDYLSNSFVLGHVADVGYSHSYIFERV